MGQALNLMWVGLNSRGGLGSWALPMGVGKGVAESILGHPPASAGCMSSTRRYVSAQSVPTRNFSEVGKPPPLALAAPTTHFLP